MMGPWGIVTPLWYGGGRVDAYAPMEDVYWGSESEWLEDDQHSHHDSDTKKLVGEDGDGGGGAGRVTRLEEPLGAVQMGLIYVNPVECVYPI